MTVLLFTFEQNGQKNTVKDGQNHNIICCNRDMIIAIRTLKTRIVTDKKDSEESFKLNGARNGLISNHLKSC